MDELKIQDIFGNLKYFGDMDNADYTGTAFDSKNNDILYIHVKMSDGIVTSIRYQIINKPVIYAICEILSSAILRKSLTDGIKSINAKRIYMELGDVPEDNLYVIYLFKEAMTKIFNEYNSSRRKKETGFKRLLNFGDEDDPDVLTDEQVKKLLDAVDDLAKNKSPDSYNQLAKVQQDVIEKPVKRFISRKERRELGDNVPSFDQYKDNTADLYFDNNQIECEFPDEKFDFDKQLEGYDYPSFSDLDNIDTDFEKDLSFSNYDFEKKDKE